MEGSKRMTDHKSVEKGNARKLIVSNIDWDTDEYEEDLGLPKKIVIDDQTLLPHLMEDVYGMAENLAEWLSSTYGFCVKGFTTNIEEV